MLYNILSLSVLLLCLGISSGNRLLLQTTGAPVAPQGPQTTQSQTPVTTAAAPAPAPVNPANPVNPSPANPGNPGVPAGPFLPPLPAPGSAASQQFTEMNCVLAANQLGSCARGQHTITNPSQNFKLNCAGYGSCYGSTIDLNYGVNPWANMPGMAQAYPQIAGGQGRGQGAAFNPYASHGSFIEKVEGVWCTEPYACFFATVNVRNTGGGNSIKLERLECSAIGACNGMQVKLWGASMNDLDCTRPENCAGCLVYDMLEPIIAGSNPKPCFNTF